MKEAVLFLTGTYRPVDLPFYKLLCQRRFKVAVDGGYRFFRKSGFRPDLLIGDMDSLDHLPRNLDSHTEIIRYPTDKDATDAELAVNYCLKHDLTRIDIVQPSVGEIDHFAGNLLLLRKVSCRTRPSVDIRLITGRKATARVLYNATCRLSSRIGSRVSILPLSATIRLTCKGMEYNVMRRLIRRGETLGLRNVVAGRRATVRVEGEALMFEET